MSFGFTGYLDCFASEDGPCCSTLEGSGLVELDQAFVELKSNACCHSRPRGTAVDLQFITGVREEAGGVHC